MAEGDQQAHKNRVDALSIFSMAAASLLVTIGGYVINDHGNRLDEHDVRITDIEIDYATLSKHLSEHDRATEHWRSEFLKLQANGIENQRRIDRIEAKPSASLDSLTEADGRRLEAMISDLQRQIYHTPQSEK